MGETPRKFRSSYLGWTVAIAFAIMIAAGVLGTSAGVTLTPAQFPGDILAGYGGSGDWVGFPKIAKGDFNNDGKLDLLAYSPCCGGSAAGGFLETALNTGGGVFSPAFFAPHMRSGSDGGGNSGAIAVGDFNHDGNLDFAIFIAGTRSGTNYFDVYLGDGTGNFTFSADYDLGSAACGNAFCNSGDIHSADLNSDGIPDIVVTTNNQSGMGNPGSAWVYLGNGDGTFTLKGSYLSNTGTSPGIYSTVADFNHDGHPDLAVADYNQNQGFDVLINNGDGSFQAPIYYDSGVSSGANGALQVVAADLGNGQIDIIESGKSSGVSVFIGNGDGTFQTPSVAYPIPTYAGGQLAVADFNGDGKPDVAVSDNGHDALDILIGNGDGTLQPAVSYAVDRLPTTVVTGDFNNDGKLDIATGNGEEALINLVYGNGDGTFQAGRIFNYSGDTLTWTSADFNNDGHPDIAIDDGVYGGNNTISVWLNNGRGVFAGPPIVTTTTGGWGGGSVNSGDLNGDGKQDLVITGSADYVNKFGVMLGNGDGTFQAPVVYSTGQSSVPCGAFVGDVNGDGFPDVITTNGDGSISVFLNDGHGGFGGGPVQTIAGAGGNGCTDIESGDFNGDGKVDLVTSDSNDQQLNILLGNGDGTFQAPAGTKVGGHLEWVTVGDLNKDGKLDLVTGYFGDYIAILLGNGDGTFQAPEVYQLYGNWGNYGNYDPSGKAAIADINGDGNPDIIFGFRPTELYSTTCCGIGAGNLGIGILLGNGDGTFSLENGYAEPGVAGGPFITGDDTQGGIIIRDFNGDGIPDVAALNEGGNDGSWVTILQNTTAGIPTVTPTATPTPVAASLSFGPKVVRFSPEPFADGGKLSAPRTVIFKNPGGRHGVVVVLEGIETTLSDFQIVPAGTTCSEGQSLEPGSKCTVELTFQPGGLGTREGQLVMTDNAHDNPQHVTLKGVGVAGKLKVAPLALSFGKVTVGTPQVSKPVTLGNNSGVQFQIGSISSTDPEFVASGDCQNQPLDSGATCSFTVTFTPASAGRHHGELEINDNADHSPQKVHLTGIGK